MKISRERLKQIIKEELEALALNEVKVYNPTTGKFEDDEPPPIGSGEVATGRLGPEATPSARTGPETMTAAERDALDQRPKTRAARAKARAGLKQSLLGKTGTRASDVGMADYDTGQPDASGVVQTSQAVSGIDVDLPDSKYAGAIAAADMGGKVVDPKKQKVAKTTRRRSGGGGNLAAAKKEMRAARAEMKQELKNKGVSSVYDLDKTNSARQRFARAYTALKRAKAGGGGSSRRMMAKAEAPKTVAQARAQSPKSVAPLRPDEPKAGSGDQAGYDQEIERQRQTKEIEARRRAAARKKKRQDLLTSLSPGDLKRFYRARRERAVDLEFSGLSPERAKKIAAKQALDALERAGSGGFATALFDTPLYGDADAGGSGKKQPAGSERMVAKGKKSSRKELQKQLADIRKKLKSKKITPTKRRILKSRERRIANKLTSMGTVASPELSDD